MNLNNLVWFLKQNVKWGHAQDEWQLLSMFLIEVELSHYLVECVVWLLTAVNLVKNDNVKVSHFEICMHQTFMESLRQKQKDIVLFQVLPPLLFSLL